MSASFDLMRVLPEGVASLPDLGVLRAEGADAATFLHGQLTQDVVLLPDGQARWAAYCSPKGRVLASFLLLRRRSDDVLLIGSRDVLSAMLKRLSMFVMRAKVKISDVSDSVALWGQLGTMGVPTDLPEAPWSACAVGDGHVVRLYPALGQARCIWVGHPPAADTALEPGLWNLGDVLSGVAWVGAAQSDAFVPQMLNYESVGGVNFKKGCYPGQEVVARSQFRGTLKRRLFLATAPDVLSPGTEVFGAADAQEACGVVVHAAALPGGGCVASLVLQTAEADQPLTSAAPAQTSLTLQALPYPLLTDI